MPITRTTWKGHATIAVNGTESTPVEAWDSSFGMIYLPSTFNGTAITFEVCDTYDGTYLPLKGDNGSNISLTVAASTAVTIPSEVMGAAYFKIVAGSAQADTATNILVDLKG